ADYGAAGGGARVASHLNDGGAAENVRGGLTGLKCLAGNLDLQPHSKPKRIAVVLEWIPWLLHTGQPERGSIIGFPDAGIARRPRGPLQQLSVSHGSGPLWWPR